MPEVLAGARNTVTLAELRTRMSNFLGFSPNDNRLKGMVLEWLNEVLMEIQLNDPQMRRLKVVDAESTVPSGATTIDVRDSEDDGGFGWDNCEEVALLLIPGLSSKPIEPLTQDQYRNRSYESGLTGGPYSVAFVDQFRIRFDKVPDQDYAIVGDYFQYLPKVTDQAGGVDFPSAWNAALVQGVKAKGTEWLHQVQPGAYQPHVNRFDAKLSELRENERVTPVRPTTAVSVRSLRGRRIPRDNSTDVGSWLRFWR